jgi:L,D-transpeptidase YbiS
MNSTDARPTLHVSIRDQRLTLIEADGATRVYPVSTARNGSGNRPGSGCTPLGLHRVKVKIGAGAPPGAVFVGRRATGEVLDDALLATDPDRDWMLSRMLWLQGMEPGVNRGGATDTMRRHVYIHGTAAETQIGTAVSFGCVRMTNADVIDLFERVPRDALVRIEE